MTTWQSASIQSGEVTIRYQRAGNGAPIILAHGFSDNGDCWKAFAEPLTATHDVILIDARNHGQSGKARHSNGAIDQANDVKALITQLDLEKPVVIGHSMGAQMAMHAAGLFPELLRAVVLEDPPMFPDVVPTADELATTKARRLGWIDSLKALNHEQLVLRCIAENPTWRAEELHHWAESKHQFGFVSDVVDYEPERTIHWQKLIPQIGVPALLISADASKGSIVPATAAAEARVLSAHIEVALIRNVGHCIRREAPQAYAALVGDFLKRTQG